MDPATLTIMINFASKFLSKVGKKAQYAQEAAVQMQQAEIYRRNAAIVRRNGSIKENSMRSEKRAAVAEQAAMMGEMGVGESPTAVTAQATAASRMESNILNERYQVESEAENYLYQSRVAKESARVLKKQSRYGITDFAFMGLEDS